MESITNPLAPQIVYLDFDGENTIYHNEDLNISLDVNVEDSLMSDTQKFYILSQLDKMYDDSEVIFTLTRPEDEEYSTVYIGKTDAFNKYGSFAGLAETIDQGNQIKNDNAFVIADYTNDLDNVITVIDHELEHIVKGMEHNITVGSLDDYSSISIPEIDMGLIYDNTNITKSGRPEHLEIYFFFTCKTSNEITISISPSPLYYFGSSHIVCFSITDLTTNLDDTYWNSSCTFSGVAGRKYQITIGPAIEKRTYSVTITGKNSSIPAPEPNPSPGGPDLRVSIVSLVSNLKSTDSATMYLSIYNDGIQIAKSSYVYVYCDNKLLKKVHIGSIASFGHIISQVSLSGSELGVGTHSIYVKADGSEIINEANESNNISKSEQIVVSGSSTPTPTPDPAPTPTPSPDTPQPEPVPQKPDLKISDFSVSKTTISTNQTLTLYFTVKNAGAATANSSYVYIYEADRKVAQVAVSSLGATKTLNLQYTFAANYFSAGTHNFYVKADGGLSVTELNEDNNYSDEISVKVNNTSTPTPDPTPDPTPTPSAGVDLTVSGVPSGVSISMGANSQYTLTFTVKNTGTNTAAASYAYIYSNNKKIGEVYVGSLGAGNSAYKSYTVTGKELGNGEHKLWVKVDGANTISESNEANNTSNEVTLKISGVTESKPDLILTDFYLHTSQIQTDEELRVYFEIKNNGNAAAGASKLYLYDGQEALCAVDLAGLAAGEARSTYFVMSKGTFTAGTHSLWLKADATNLVAESNENNNASAIKTVTVSNLADLIISSFTTSTATITSKQSVTLSFSVKNQGDKFVSSSYVYIYDGDKYLDKVYIGNLDKGASLSKSYTIYSGILSSGTHDLKIMADGTDVVLESNENNNYSTSKTVTVTSTPEQKADLVISDFSTSAATINSKQSVTLNFTVKNQGDKFVSSSYACIYDGNTLLGKVYIGNLDAGASLNSSYTIYSGILSEGTHDLKIMADGTGVVPESNENNNYSTIKTITVTSAPEQKADLVISDFTTSAATINSKQSVTLNFTVKNQGDKFVSSSYVYIYDGDKYLDKVYIGNLDVGASLSKSYTIYSGILSEGAHNLKVVADGSSVVPESNENNNASAIKTVTVSNLADLVISSFTTSTATITSKQSVTLSFSVKNQGDKFVSSSYVYIYDGDKYLDKVYIGNLDKGASLSKTYTIYSGILSEGAHNLKVVADGSAVVPESNENNNASAIKTVTVSNLADLVISSFTTSTDSINSKQSVTLNFSVKNQGDKFVSSSYVYIYDGDKYLDKVYIGNLDKGASLNSSYTIYSGILCEGTHDLKIMADSTGVVPESNENNNYSTIKTITVTSAPEQKADLVISDFTTSAATINSKQSVTLNFTVKNQGDKFVSSSYVYIYDGDKYLDKVYIGNLDVGASLSKSYTIYSGILSEGAHNLKVVADGSSVVPESNENNNASAIKTVTVSNLADLVISSFTTSTDSINSKQSVTLNFSVKNQGDKFVSSSYVYIYDGDKYLDKVYIGNLDVGASLSKSYTIYSGILSEGAHNLKVVADGSSVVPESNENNNASAIKTVTVSNLADLVISSFTTSTDKITSKQSVTLSFSVKNQGDKFVSSSYVYIYDGDKYLDKVYIGNLDKGASLSKTYTIYSGILSEGTHNLKVVADGSAVVPESNENNNASAIKTVTVENLLADLVISSFTTSTDKITSKQSVTLSFSVKNQGDKFVSSSYVYIYDGDKYLDKVYIGNLDSGASLSKSYTIYSGILSEGTHNLKLVADGSSVVPESNENNNASAIKTVTVTGAASNNFPDVFMAGDFNGILYLSPDGTIALATLNGVQTTSDTIDRSTWELIGTGDFNKSGSDGLLWQEKATGHIYMQNNLANFNEITNRSNFLGTLTDDYKYLGIGDFTGTGMDGIVMQGPAFGNSSVSLNYGLPIWGREANGTVFNGWLGALVNTWQPGQALKGNTANLADINAKNYMYEVVAVGDFNGDGVDDVMLQNIMPKTVNGVTITGSGDVFTFLTGDINDVKAGASPTVAYAGCATDGWGIVGVGDFDGNGIDDVLLSDGSGIAGWSMYNGQRLNDFWFGTLYKDEVIIGTTDLDNNGKDDIIIRETTTNQLYYISC